VSAARSAGAPAPPLRQFLLSANIGQCKGCTSRGHPVKHLLLLSGRLLLTCPVLDCKLNPDSCQQALSAARL
jgi:hypothetical protein